MAHRYTQLYYHIVWATRGREPLLTPSVLGAVQRAIRLKSSELGATTHAANGPEDHLHLAVELPATLAVAEYVEQVKGYASWAVNHDEKPETSLYWQNGYSALTFRKSDLSTVVGYILRQQEHHASSRLWSEFELSEPAKSRG